MSENQLFQLNAVEAFTVRIISGGKKSCRLRYPTDEEWCRRAKSVKVIRTPLGRDKSQTDSPGQIEADAELFERIRKDDPRQEFTQNEASEFIRRIDAGRVLEGVLVLDTFRIVLELPGNLETIHVVSIPSQKDLDDYERASIQWINGKRHQEITTSLEPAGRLYDAIIRMSEGYTGTVPITHKYLVIREAIDQVDALKEEIDAPEV